MAQIVPHYVDVENLRKREHKEGRSLLATGRVPSRQCEVELKRLVRRRMVEGV